MLLKDHQKFDLLLNTPKKAVAAADGAKGRNDEDYGARNDSGEEREESSRPIGCVRTKEMEVKSEINAKKFRVAKASLATKDKTNKLTKLPCEIADTMSQMDKNDLVVREYILIKRRCIPQQLRRSKVDSIYEETGFRSTAYEKQ